MSPSAAEMLLGLSLLLLLLVLSLSCADVPKSLKRSLSHHLEQVQKGERQVVNSSVLKFRSKHSTGLKKEWQLIDSPHQTMNESLHASCAACELPRRAFEARDPGASRLDTVQYVGCPVEVWMSTTSGVWWGGFGGLRKSRACSTLEVWDCVFIACVTILLIILTILSHLFICCL